MIQFEKASLASVLQVGERIAPARGNQDQYCIVRSGWIGLFSHRQDGTRQLLRLVLPGEMFWLKACDLAWVLQSAEALTPASCSRLGQAEARALFRSDPSQMDLYAATLERELSLSYDSMVNLGRRDAAAQILHFLVSLAMRSTGRDILQTLEACRIPLTQRTIGEALGLTQIHVNRTIRHLRSEGLLTFQGGTFLPLDPDRIGEMIDLTPEMRALWLARLPTS